MLVKVLNYNSKYSNAQLIRDDKEDDTFSALVSEGGIGTNSIQIEINSSRNINCDVEFYGYKDNLMENDNEDEEKL
jgi:hypothetical protein